MNDSPQEGNQHGGSKSDTRSGGSNDSGDIVDKGSVDHVDPNVVDFNGPDDPACAVNWSRRKKWTMVACLSIMTLITPLASSMFAPGVPVMLEGFGIKGNITIIGSFAVSIFILGYAFGPMVLAPLSELYGRQYVYLASNVLFVVFTIGCALSTNIGMLLAFRFLAGFAGSAVITLGGGTIADLFIQQERASAITIWSLGPLVGPAIGPVAGGFLAESEGWRWVFWVIAMAGGVVTALFILFMRETYAPVILQRKAARLRKETGNPNLYAKGSQTATPRVLFTRAIVRPFKLLLFSPICLSLSVYCAVAYGYFYLLFTTINGVFLEYYGFSTGIVGLTYIGAGVGTLIGLIAVGSMSDRTLKRRAAASGGEMKPEYRLPFMIPSAFAIPIGLILYGWSAERHVFWLVPILGTVIVGFGMMGILFAINTYLIDAFTIYAASAMAANAILRSLFGAFLPLAAPPMYAALGQGWGNSVLAFIATALLFIPFLLIRYGEYLRKRFPVAL